MYDENLLADFLRAAERNSPPPAPTKSDPTARMSVKPVRGGIPAIPVVQHESFKGCPDGQACNCPPVDSAAWIEAHAGVVSRGASTRAKTAKYPQSYFGSTSGATVRPKTWRWPLQDRIAAAFMCGFTDAQTAIARRQLARIATEKR